MVFSSSLSNILFQRTKPHSRHVIRATQIDLTENPKTDNSKNFTKKYYENYLKHTELFTIHHRQWLESEPA